MMPYRCGILTLSDKGARGEREDTAGPTVRDLLVTAGYQVTHYEMIPDEQPLIRQRLMRWVDDEQLDLIITTGGTGLSPRDVTPEATQAILDYEIPGIAEAMRHASMKKTIHAMLSRGVAGVRKKSMIINLPGSKKAAEENIAVVLPALVHAIYKLQGGKKDCG